MRATARLFDADSHLFVFDATVLSCEPLAGGEYAVILDKTAFFPEGGGHAGRGTCPGCAGERRRRDLPYTAFPAVPRRSRARGGGRGCPPGTDAVPFGRASRVRRCVCAVRLSQRGLSFGR